MYISAYTAYFEPLKLPSIFLARHLRIELVTKHLSQIHITHAAQKYVF